MDWQKLIFGSVALLVQYFAEQFLKEDFAETFPVKSNDYFLPSVETYDFIIVGAGTAGCVVASRLSENPNVKVLLLEAGGNPPPQVAVPALAFETISALGISYHYNTVPQKYANNSVLPLVLGRVMGGTSTVNKMWWNRGHPRDFDNWANLTGDESWKYKNLLKYFKRSENYKGEFPVGDAHGVNGPVTVSRQVYAPGRAEWFYAGEEKGYKIVDPNGPQQEGFCPIEYSKQNGRRVSSYSAYLQPIEARSNLKVERYAEVTQISFDPNNNSRVEGVVYKRHGIFQGAFASKEVIVCAGAYGSPILLMKSGIGPPRHLKQIETKVALPVGENLQDHPMSLLKILIGNNSLRFEPQRDIDENTVKEFISEGKGYLTSTKVATAQAFLVSSVAMEEKENDWPDIQIYPFGEKQGAYNVSHDYSKDEKCIYMYSSLVRSRSRGRVTLNTSDIHAPPLIDLNFLQDKKDLKILVEIVKKSVDLFETTRVYRIAGARYSTRPLPACSNVPFRTDPYWECYLRNTMQTGHQPGGTCRMGRGKSDPNAVVDSKLRVIGVENLRVVDTSIMPVITNANLLAAVYMVAEKSSDDIKSRWGLSDDQI